MRRLCLYYMLDDDKAGVSYAAIPTIPAPVAPASRLRLVKTAGGTQ